MSTRRQRGLVVGLLLTAVRHAHAGETAYPGPPITIDDAETVEPGHLELNLTTSLAVSRGSFEAELPRVDANYGLSANMHANIEFPLVLGLDDGAHRRGVGDIATALKLRLINADRFELTLHPDLDLPPIPAVSVEAHGSASVFLPLIVNVALGDGGAGLGLELARSFTQKAADGSWSAGLGLAAPLGGPNSIMGDYWHSADPDLRLRDGWFEAAFLRDHLFGSRHLILLSALGHSLRNHGYALLGVRVWL